MEGNIRQQITISVLPFQYVGALADIETGEIFVGGRFFDALEQNIRHEVAHVVSGDPDHGDRFLQMADALGVDKVPDVDVFKSLRRRLGISAKIAGNIGNISGIQNILTDYHLLQAYRKFSQKVLGTEGHWEVINEVDGESKDQLIRLYPTPKGAFPVVVLYMPVINHFRSPQAKYLAYRMLEAQAMIAIGSARRKIAGMPTPDGGSINYDGGELVTEGREIEKNIVQEAINYAEPLGPWLW